MKTYGLDMQGPLIMERLSDLPTWQESFIGRVVYLTSNGFLYLATASGWVKLIGENDLQSDGLIRKYVSSIDATATGLYSIYIVPEGYMFIVNTFDVLIEDIFGAGVMPEVNFGILENPSLCVTSELLQVDPTPYKRQLWDKPFGPALQGTNFVFSISEAATYSNLVISAIITGYLVPFTALGPSEPERAYRLLYRNEEYSW